MNKDNINISRVETYLNSIFDNQVSNNTFFGYIPQKEVVESSWEDFVAIEIPRGIEDHDAFGEGTIIVWLYARPLVSGRKNVAKFDELEVKLNEVLRTASNETYTLSRIATYTDYDNELNWHCNAIEIIIKVY